MKKKPRSSLSDNSTQYCLEAYHVQDRVCGKENSDGGGGRGFPGLQTSLEVLLSQRSGCATWETGLDACVLFHPVA